MASICSPQMLHDLTVHISWVLIFTYLTRQSHGYYIKFNVFWKFCMVSPASIHCDFKQPENCPVEIFTVKCWCFIGSEKKKYTTWMFKQAASPSKSCCGECRGANAEVQMLPITQCTTTIANTILVFVLCWYDIGDIMGLGKGMMFIKGKIAYFFCFFFCYCSSNWIEWKPCACLLSDYL